MKKASIIIPTKDKLSRLRLVLNALEHQINEEIEVLVIFDDCSDEVLRDFENIKLSFEPIKIIYNQNIGRAKARNSGIMQAIGEIVIFLDDDRIPNPDFVNKHLNRHENGRYAIIGERSNIIYSEEKIEQFYHNEFGFSDFIQMEKNKIKEKYDFFEKIGQRIFGQLLYSISFTTGNSSVRRQDLIKVGMFDENYTGWGVEDVDLGYRLIKDGVKVISDYSIVNYHLIHPVDQKKKKDDFMRNYKYFLNKINNDKIVKFLAKILYMCFPPYK